MRILKSSIRHLLQGWAKWGRAPGYLHQVVDQYGGSLADYNLLRSIYGGGKILCHLKDHVQSRIYFLGAYEPIEAYLFLQLIRPKDHIVDAGANVGFYSLISASQLDESGKVYAFEPVPKNYQQLFNNIQLSGSPSIEVLPLGLWNQRDILKFSLPKGMEQNAGSFSVGGEGSQYIECDVVTLDELVDAGKIEAVDLMKMDIEGAEWFALQGAQKTLRQFLPTVLMEINQGACQNLGYRSEKMDKIFLDLGYKIFHVKATPQMSGYVSSTTSIQQGNVFFVSPKHHDRFKDQWNHREVRKFFARN